MARNIWVKLPKGIVARRWYKNADAVRLYVHFLIASDHAGYERGCVAIKPGELAATRGELAAALGMTSGEVWRALRSLGREGDIVWERCKGFTVFKVASDKLRTSFGQASDNQQGAEFLTETRENQADKKPFGQPSDNPWTSFGQASKNIKDYKTKKEKERDIINNISKENEKNSDGDLADGRSLDGDRTADLADGRETAEKKADLANGRETASESTLSADGRGSGKARATRFVPPSTEEVSAYCAERSNGVDASAFVDYYTAKGWRVGSSPMKDWRAAVRTWERNSRRFDAPQSGVRASGARTDTALGAASSFDTEDFFSAALERSYRK